MLSGFTPKERECKLDYDTGKERVHAWSQPAVAPILVMSSELTIDWTFSPGAMFSHPCTFIEHARSCGHLQKEEEESRDITKTMLLSR